MTVEEALRLPELRTGVPEVLAGRNQLSREIRWVHAGEFPEMHSVLKGGELLLTTGMGMPRENEELAGWLGKLDSSGISGLVIELGSALGSVPAVMVAEANRRELPLIALHRPIPFIKATEVIHRWLLSHQSAVAERGENAQTLLTDLLIDGVGTAELIEALAKALARPVLLARANGNVLFHSGFDLREADVISLWESHRGGLEDAPEVLSAPVRRGRDANWAELAALGLGRSFDEGDRTTLVRCAPVVAVALRREHETRAMSSRARGEFLHEFAFGEAELMEYEAEVRATSLGFARPWSQLLPVVVAASGAHPYHSQWERISAALQGSFRQSGRKALFGLAPDAEGILLVAGLAPEADREAVAEEIGLTVQDAADKLGLPAAGLSVAIGRNVFGWRELRPALRDTVASSRFAAWRRPAVWHDASAPDIPELLAPLRETSVLRRFVGSRLDPLIDHDARQRSELVATLEAYYANGARKADAARDLHLVRQSLYKRLAKIAELLDADIDDEETRLALQLALRARHLTR